MKRISIVVLTSCACPRPRGMGTAANVQGPQPVAQIHRPMQRSNPCEKLLNVIHVGTLVGLWSYNTGSSMQSSTAVANGVVYVGTEHGDVYAFRLK